MDDKNVQVCSELCCLLNYFPETYMNRLPKKLFILIQKNSNSKYFVNVDTTKPLNEQKVLKETKDALIVLKYNYWYNDEEKNNIITKLNENEKKHKEMLEEKYNPDTLFKNRSPKIEKENTSVAMVECKESFFIKIKNFFKRTF